MRLLACDALGSIGGDVVAAAKEAILKELKKRQNEDDFKEVREAAKDAIQKIEGPPSESGQLERRLQAIVDLLQERRRENADLLADQAFMDSKELPALHRRVCVQPRCLTIRGPDFDEQLRWISANVLQVFTDESDDRFIQKRVAHVALHNNRRPDL
jgi:hypothetical protein